MVDREISPASVNDVFREYYETVKTQILRRLIDGTPDFFESVVVDLMLALNYGKSAEIVGKSGDGGIDGIVYDDPLGFDAIHLQAKRWTNSVGRPDLQAFYGALQGIAATRGVFITTSQFTKHAREYTKGLPIKIILIDGKQLAELMYDYNVGVSRTGVLEIKALDDSYFNDEKA